MDDNNIPAGLDEFLAQPAQTPNAATVPHTPNAEPPGLNDFINEEVMEEQYGTPGQMAITALEGASQGALGPLAPIVETEMFGVNPKDIRAREQTNPVTHGVSEAATLVGGALTGVGEGAVLAKAGQLAVDAAGLAKASSYAAKVGSATVRNAVEAAVYQAGDEGTKAILQDPSYSAESALANVGMASLFGGVAGGALQGTVSPLWEATVGKSMDKFLGGVKGHLDGDGIIQVPEAINKSVDELGIAISPELRAAMSGNPKAAQMFNELREVQHSKIISQMADFEAQANNSVMNSFKHTAEDIANYSEAEGGVKAMNAFKHEMKEKYEPIAKAYEEITERFKDAPVDIPQKATLTEKVATLALDRGYLGTDIPQEPVIQKVLSLIPEAKTAADYSRINTIVDNMTAGNLQLRRVGRELKDLIIDAQHSSVANKIGTSAPDLMEKYLATRKGYAEFAKTSQQLADELGLGRFQGYKGFLEKLSAKRSPEQFLRRLSPKGNAEIIEFLGKNFPQTLENIRDNELRQLLKPAVLGAKGESQINTKILANAIEKGLAGRKEHIEFAIPKESIAKIQAAKQLFDSIPAMKSSGTAGWQQALSRKVAPSALAAVAALTGNNPIVGWVLGEGARLMSREAPDAFKVAMLKFLGSDQPIKGAGFKAMVEFIDNSLKGQNILNKAIQNVFKAGAAVTASNYIPNQKERDKLDKAVEQLKIKPDGMMRVAEGGPGHYMPESQQALAQSTVTALQYLQTLKPEDEQLSPLDMPIKPSKAKQSRYNRALDIANSPTIVLDAVKDGSITISDMQDLKSMYPSLYMGMANKLSNEMITAKSKKERIPYKTRMGLSLFLQQPMDSTMTPQAIQQSAQILAPMQQEQQQQNAVKPSATATGKLGKSNSSYQTPGQASEKRHTDPR